MAKSTSVQLNDHWQNFIAERIEKGRFDSVSEAVRAGLRLVEREEQKFDRLCAALDAGLASGPGIPFDMDEWLVEQRTLDQAA